MATVPPTIHHADRTFAGRGRACGDPARVDPDGAVRLAVMAPPRAVRADCGLLCLLLRPARAH